MLRFFHSKRLIFCAILLWIPSASVFARTFHVEDANGQPLENAVILLPGATDTGADSMAVMDQMNKLFVPLVLVIQRGQRVTFPNSDNIRHHVYSFSPTKPFEIKLYSGAPKEPILFDTAGIVVLGCNIHDRMVGYIVVSDTALAGKTDAQGNVSLADGAPPDLLRVWHPLLQTPVPAPLSIPLPAADANGVHTIKLQVSTPPPEPDRATFGNRLRRSHAP